MLLRWALDRCARDRFPAYLESTVEAGPLYRRHGFAVAETISTVLDGAGNGIPSWSSSSSEAAAGVLYEEICFLFTPSGVGSS